MVLTYILISYNKTDNVRLSEGEPYMIRRLSPFIAAGLITVIASLPGAGYVAYETHVNFLQTVTKDILKLMPRAMGSYIFQSRYDFMRGMTFMTRNIQFSPRKLKDLEEIRREAYERLMRDIPYCVEAFKGGEIKLDTSASNLAGRLGMIAYSIILLKMPDFPDQTYLQKFSMILDELVAENGVEIRLFYDGYGDFNSLGELMERFRPEFTPTFKHVRTNVQTRHTPDKFKPAEKLALEDSVDEDYIAIMREDVYAMFRAPAKLKTNMQLTDADINMIYNAMINDILDAFVYIWKCSGMDLAHPSYAAPPGTVIKRADRRSMLSGGGSTTPEARLPLGSGEKAGLRQ
jgi:hypothetical protein